MVRIENPEAFQQIIRAATAHFHGQVATAKALGVDQARISRWLSARGARRIEEETFEHVTKGLGESRPDLVQALKDCVLGEEVAQHLIMYYWAWCSDELERLTKAHVREIETALLGTEKYRRLIQNFLDRAPRTSTGKMKDHRVQLALYRALEPLAAAQATRGIELHWQELDARGALTGFLEESLTRERRLLKRAQDGERADAALRGATRRGLARWRNAGTKRAQ